MDAQDLHWLDHRGERLAYRRRNGASPTLLFLPGYMSDMEGAKAAAVEAFAAARGLGCLRFDYSGTGSSSGSFEHGTLAGWLDDALTMLDQLTEGPVLAVGSSMGGWLSFHLALQRPERIVGIVGIAAAPDFTDWGFGASERERLQRDGRIDDRAGNDTSGRFFTHAFWTSGQNLRLLRDPIAVDCPVRLVHGAEDADVPVSVATTTMAAVRSADVQLTIVKGGGHRLSAPHEIDVILRAIAGLLEPNA